jgi:hypothetical protein
MNVAPHIQMISPNKHDAPHFTGRTTALAEFLEEYELAADAAQLSPEEKCKRAYKYVAEDEQDTWRLHPTRLGKDWKDYVKAMMQSYPGSERDRLYTPAELRKFVKDQKRTEVKNVDDLGLYHREFTKRANFLIAAKKISNSERADYYWSGFHKKFQKRLELRLLAAHPDHDEGDTFPEVEVFSAARHLLANTRPKDKKKKRKTKAERKKRRDEDEDEDDEEEEEASEDDEDEEEDEEEEEEPSKKIKGKKKAKTEVKAEDTNMAAIAAALQSLANKMDSALSAGSRIAPISNSRPYGNSFSEGCLFCGDRNHILRNCSVADEYIREGKVVKNDLNRLELPNRAPLPRPNVGSNFRAAVDAWHGLNPNSRAPPTTTVGMVAIAGVMLYEVLGIECEEETQGDGMTEDEFWTEVSALTAAGSKSNDPSKRVRFEFDGVEVPAPPSTRPKPKAPDHPASSPVPPPSGKGGNSSTVPLNKPTHTFKYKSAAEDEKLISECMDMILEG